MAVLTTRSLRSTCSASGADSTGAGVACAVLTCVLSALGGVYSEQLMKHGAAAHSIHLQNALLYVWGILFNSLTLLGADGRRIWTYGLLYGYSTTVWVLIANVRRCMQRSPGHAALAAEPSLALSPAPHL